MVVYDATIGGSGLSKIFCKRFENSLKVAYELMHRCDCDDGCSRCIHSPYCGNNNKVLSKRKALQLLEPTPEKPLESRIGKPLA